jgi:hypothetical protein
MTQDVDLVTDFLNPMIAMVVALVVVVLTIALISTGFGFFEFGFNIGNGEQVGYISEIENDGFLWQPTDVKLISVEPTFSETDTAWHYAVLDESITEKARYYMNTHEKVVVTYVTHQFEGRWDYSHRTIITEIAIAQAGIP